MTPDDVREQTFKERFKGYDVEEVDAFLERVMDALAELHQEREDAAHTIEELQARLGDHPPQPAISAPAAASPAEAEPVSSDLVSRTLLTAQRAADETIARAQAEAERLVADAQTEADRKMRDVQHQIAAERERLEDEAARVARVAEGLVRFRAEYRKRVEQVISDQLALLERTELPDVPDALRELASFTPEADPPAVLSPGTDEPSSTLESLTESSALRDPEPHRNHGDELDQTAQMRMPTEGHVGEG